MQLQKDQRKIGDNMGNEQRGPGVGDLAPEFFVQVGGSKLSLSQLAARRDKLVLLSQDSYRYHPN
jgi:hypothetical protein